jgi:hypothetical protein
LLGRLSAYLADLLGREPECREEVVVELKEVCDPSAPAVFLVAEEEAAGGLRVVDCPLIGQLEVDVVFRHQQCRRSSIGFRMIFLDPDQLEGLPC